MTSNFRPHRRAWRNPWAVSVRRRVTSVVLRPRAARPNAVGTSCKTKPIRGCRVPVRALGGLPNAMDRLWAPRKRLTASLRAGPCRAKRSQFAAGRMDAKCLTKKGLGQEHADDASEKQSQFVGPSSLALPSRRQTHFASRHCRKGRASSEAPADVPASRGLPCKTKPICRCPNRR